MKRRVCAVLVNYKTAEMTRDCVASLASQLDAELDRIVVVDNDSGGEEVRRLEQALRSLSLGRLVTILPLPGNDGFSAGNNAGIRSCEAEYYLLTNSDTLFRDGAVKALLAGALAHPDAGIVSPRLEWPDRVPQVSCFRFHRPPSETIHSANSGPVTRLLRNYEIPLQPVEAISFPQWTSFACVLVRRAVFDAIGYLDDGFFMYYEDEDFCRRTRGAGFGIVNWPAAKVVHLQGKSSDFDARALAKKPLPDYVYHARSRYYRKHFGYAGWLFANLCWLFGRFLSLMRQGLGRFPQPVAKGECVGIWKTKTATRRG